MNNALAIPSRTPISAFPAERAEAAYKPLLADFPDLLTVKHIAGLTGLSAQTIRRAMSSEQIPSVKIGRTFYCPKSKFIEYLEGGANEQ